MPNAPQTAVLGTAGWWTYLFPAALLVLALLWWHHGPIVPGTFLAGSALACVVLLVRADRARTPEKVVWTTIAALLLIAELGFALQVRTLSRSLLVGRLVSGQECLVTHQGKNVGLPAVSLFIMDLDGMNRLQAARDENDAHYKPLIQRVTLGDFKPTEQSTFPIRPIAPSNGVSHYRLVFYSKHTLWWEDLQVAHFQQKQVEAYRVVGYRGLYPAVLAYHQDPEFRTAVGSPPDWHWAEREP